MWNVWGIDVNGDKRLVANGFQTEEDAWDCVEYLYNVEDSEYKEFQQFSYEYVAA